MSRRRCCNNLSKASGQILKSAGLQMHVGAVPKQDAPKAVPFGFVDPIADRKGLCDPGACRRYRTG
jgi:hypothetical protein